MACSVQRELSIPLQAGAGDCLWACGFVCIDGVHYIGVFVGMVAAKGVDRDRGWRGLRAC